MTSAFSSLSLGFIATSCEESAHVRVPKATISMRSYQALLIMEIIYPHLRRVEVWK